MIPSKELELRANFLQKFDECLKQKDKGREYYETQAAAEIDAQETQITKQINDLQQK